MLLRSQVSEFEKDCGDFNVYKTKTNQTESQLKEVKGFKAADLWLSSVHTWHSHCPEKWVSIVFSFLLSGLFTFVSLLQWEGEVTFTFDGFIFQNCSSSASGS